MNHKTLVNKCIKFCGGRTQLANKLAEVRGKKVTTTYIHHWTKGTTAVQPETAHELEIITNGLVKRVDFYPKLFGDLQDT